MSAWADRQHLAAPDHMRTLEDLLDFRVDSTVAPMRQFLVRLLEQENPEASIRSAHRIKKGVHRLAFDVGATTRSVIFKRLDPDVAHRNQVLVTRWLPAVGLEHGGPPLLGSVAEPDGERIWHVYEDLGEMTLDSDPTDMVRVEESLRLIAAVHGRFAGHALLGECRLWGGDLGMPFYHSNAVDGIRALEALDPAGWRPVHRTARHTLLETLQEMLDNGAQIASLLAEQGGPETLLHGDLWRQNVLLVPAGQDEFRPRLIDWDHVGVGQVSYDLSTLLSRFASSERHTVLEMYRQEMSPAGWQLPDSRILNRLFDAAERARIANRVIWPAVEIRFGSQMEWALDHLVELSQWFDRIEPVL